MSASYWRNPLAEPTTVGVGQGARLRITSHHALGDPSRDGEPVCCAGRGLSCSLNYFRVAWGKRLSPVTLIFAGLVVSLYCGAMISYWLSSIMTSLQSIFSVERWNAQRKPTGAVFTFWPQLLGGVMLTLLLLVR
ncbi:iron chelate uptake ABC transporter family permease subunit [Shigella flexneri]